MPGIIHIVESRGVGIMHGHHLHRVIVIIVVIINQAIFRMPGLLWLVHVVRVVLLLLRVCLALHLGVGGIAVVHLLGFIGGHGWPCWIWGIVGHVDVHIQVLDVGVVLPRV